MRTASQGTSEEVCVGDFKETRIIAIELGVTFRALFYCLAVSIDSVYLAHE